MKNSPSTTTNYTHPEIPEAFIDPVDNDARPVKMAVPDEASRILNAMGYPVNAKLLRKWAKERKIPSCWTGRRLLIKIAAVIEFMESDAGAPEREGDYDDE